VSFDGSGDRLSLSGNNDFVFGAPSGSTNDFTIEGFFYLNSFAASYYVLGGIWSAETSEEWLIQIQNNGNMRFLTTAGTSFYSANIATGRWYHFAAVRSSSTITLYVDGVSVGSYTNSNSLGSNSKTVYWGTQDGGTWDWNGFISNIHVVKGTALYTTNFTPPTGPISSVANTKLLCCKSNSSATAADVTPGTITANGNAAATNFNPFTANINTQRGKQSGYATLNPLFRGGGAATYSNGNLNCNTGNANGHVRSNIGISGGKYYFEAVGTANVATAGMIVGVVQEAATPTFNIGGDSLGYGYFIDGRKANGGYSAYGSSWTTGDVIGVAFDSTNGTLTFYKNGVSQGVAFTGLTSYPYYPAVSDTTSGEGVGFEINFGQKPFKFPPPAGFQPLTLANTPRPTIVRPDQYVGVTTYTGTGSSRNVNVGFKPDFVWIKKRNGI